MKRFRWLVLFVALVPTLLSAKPRKMTVAQLQDFLTGLHKAQKSDEQIANDLKQIELTEELTSSAMNSMANLVNGPLSTEQMYVLEARTAILAPPDTDLPKKAPPETGAQHALLAKAEDYASKTYPQLPQFTATRLIARFQDGVETIPSYGGNKLKILSNDDPLWEQINHDVRLVKTHTDTVEVDGGIEKPGGKDATPWGRNGFVNSMLPFLPLNLLTSEAISSGKPKFLRWETVDGHQTAVFIYAVNKKKSDYAINYCCFPETSSLSTALFGGNGARGGGLSGFSSGSLSSGPLARPAGNGNLSYVSDWNPFKAKSGYHGELFLDPDSGAILRTIVEAEFKPSAFVHYEDIRVDYAPIGRGNLYIPVRSFTIAEVVPNGASFVTRYAVRHQFVTQDYKDFHAKDGAFQVASLVTQVPKTGVSQASFTRRVVDDSDVVPPGGFPALETISRPSGPLDISASANSILRPPDEEITALLAEAAQNANSYWDSLPNFTCQQVTERFAGSTRGDKWDQIDAITGRLDYFDRQEHWEFQEYEKDHKKHHDNDFDPRHGISDFGIFGGVMRGIFRPASKANISWFENDTLGKATVQVFKYRVAKENSNFSLRASSMEVTFVGYHGMVYIDSGTGEVRRITQIADDVPKGYPIYETLVSTDYDYVSIGGQRYLLPIGAQVVLRERNHRGKLELNQIQFTDFHRFRSTSRILTDSSTHSK